MFTSSHPARPFWAVVVGAALATLGGFVATQLEAHLGRRDRERGAALLFGEILSALETITAIAGESRKRGEPYGSMTLRLVKAAQREIETYERNRASLYDLRDAEVRIRIHVIMVQVRLALEGILDTSLRITETRSGQGPANSLEHNGDEVQQRLETLSAEREMAFDFTRRASGELNALVQDLQPLAKVNFSALKRFSGNPFADGG
jgi:hypothetical protein